MSEVEGRDYQALLQFLYLMPFGVIKMQMDGTVDFINPVASQMLQTAIPGISCENGWEALKHLDPTRREKVLPLGGHFGPVGTESRCVISNDPHHPQYAVISVFRVDTLSLMVILADNTKLVLEEQSVKAALRTKRDFVACISHEMRTPLNGVIGITDMLLDTQLDPEQRNHLNIVKTSGESLLGVLNDILDYSKMEAGKLRLDANPFSLRAVLNNALEIMSFSAQRKGLEIRETVEAGCPDALIGDPARVRQVLINLAGNAIKFTEHGGLKISVRQDFLRNDTIGLQFSVEDTGIGIPLEKQSLIFEAFTQADQSTTRRYGGTGLGLSICASLVGMLSGRIWVESEVGKGSRFHFTAQFKLPRVRQDTVAPDAGSGEKETSRRPAPTVVKVARGLRILLVEDNHVNRLIGVKLLEKRGHAVITASNGREAIDAFVTHPVDLVLMDINMPEMDGLEAAEAIRRKEVPLGTQIPIVALTASTLDTHQEECIKGGMNDFLTKPIEPAALDEVLSRYAASKYSARDQLHEEQNRSA